MKPLCYTVSLVSADWRVTQVQIKVLPGTARTTPPPGHRLFSIDDPWQEDGDLSSIKSKEFFSRSTNFQHAHSVPIVGVGKERRTLIGR